MKNQIQLTAAAAQKINLLAEEEGNANLGLRVYIEGGGCSGFKYGLTLEDVRDGVDPEDSQLFELQGVKVAVDLMSLQYLSGAEIDYLNDIEGERFIIRNPSAKTTCGCGSSFSIDG